MMRTKRLLISFILSLGLALALLSLLSERETPSVAALADELHVCPAGPPACDYVTIQAAVDAANNGDIIKVAAGTYTDLHACPRNDVTTTGVVTQVVYVSKTVTIRGGYTTNNWTTSDPDANPTILDAQGQGRVLYITGDISPTIEGLRITGGDATGLGGTPGEDDDAGGGVYVISATVTLNGNDIHSNNAGTGSNDYGGGVYVQESDNATLSRNDVHGNTAFYGGGVYLYNSDNTTLNSNDISYNTAGWTGGVVVYSSNDATLSGNDIYNNTADFGSGGGIALHGGHNATLSGNEIWNNYAGLVNGLFGGGGVYVQYSDNLTLSGNEIYVNTAGSGPSIDWGSYGGGVALYKSNNATLNGNEIWGNMADDKPGGGVALHESYNATLDNNVIAGNHADANGSGIYVAESTARLRHDTLANNGGGDGSGLHVAYTSTVAFTNTILVHHTVGITVSADSTATLEATLWGIDWWANESDCGGAGIIVTGTHNYWGDPAFVILGLGDYHISENSAAIDKGIDAGVSTDMDGEPRDLAPDLGADEFLTRTCWARVNDDSTDYFAVQPAVDAAGPGDLVKVAGVCVGAVKGEGRLRQQIYLDKSLTIQGGYTTTNWITPDPEANPTILDAWGQGRVLYITGDIYPTIEGLYITGGDATGLGGGPHGVDVGGGGMYINNATVTLINNVIADNQANSPLPTLYIKGSSSRLLHNTIAHNGASNGIHVGDGWDPSSVVMTNTILVSHTVGIFVTEGSTVTLEATLWGTGTWANVSDWGGAGTIFVGTHNYWGDPLFVDADAGNYHIAPSSAAVDKGVDAGVNDDIDGDPRPMGWNYDIGADELRIALSVTKQAWPDVVQAGTQLTHTLRVTNTGDLTLTATITDVLPEHVTPGGARTWTAVLPVPDGVWTETVVVTVEMGYAGPLTNVARVTTKEGATGIYTTTSLSLAPHLEATKEAHPDPVQAGETLTYTLRVTNTGNVDLHATVTDTLPTRVTPTGILNWTPDPITPGGVWTEQFNVTVEMGYAGLLTNVVHVTTDEGATGIYTETSLSLVPHLEVNKQADPDPVQAGAQLTYTLCITNTGNVDLHTTVTDMLPAYVIPTGVLTWTPSISAPAGVWMETVVVTVEMGYAGPLTNVVQVATKEGATGICTEVSTVKEGNYPVYLPLVVRND